MNAALAPARFARIVTALAVQHEARPVGSECLSVLTSAVDLITWVPRAGHLVMQAAEIETGRVLGTVTVCPGVERAFDVITSGVVIGETRGPAAAYSLALDHLVAPLRDGAQAAPDAFAV